MFRRASLSLLAVLGLCTPDVVAAQAVHVESIYTVDAFANVSGGIATGTDLLHNMDVTIGIDGESLLGVGGLDAFVYVLANAGGSVGSLAGDWQGASNIEAPAAVRLYEAWIRKQWGEQFSLLFGLYDLNSEFYVAESGTLFINSAHGIGPEFAASGHSGPSIFPVTSLTARLRWQPSPSSYVMLGVLDAVPSDLGRPSTVAPAYNHGVLVVSEAGVQHAADRTTGYRKLAVGVWTYTAEFEDAVSAGVMREGTHGAYMLGEAEFFRETGAQGQGAIAYGRVGYADEVVHPVNWSWGGGVVYTGLFPGRDADAAGLSIAVARHASRYVQAQLRDGIDRDRREIALEATYAAEAAPWLSIQPNAQYIINPGMNRDLDNAFLLGIRLAIRF